MTRYFSLIDGAEISEFHVLDKKLSPARAGDWYFPDEFDDAAMQNFSGSDSVFVLIENEEEGRIWISVREEHSGELLTDEDFNE